MGDSKCPPPPTIEQKFETIKSALGGLGGDQKCKNTFENAVNNKLLKVDAAVAAVSLMGGGGGTMSLSDSQQQLNSKLIKDGCTSIFANINQQMESSQNILCELNQSKNVTTLNGSANATISIGQMKQTKEQIELKEKMLDKLVEPRQPVMPQYIPGESLAMFKLVQEGYKLAMNHWIEAKKIVQSEIENITGKFNLSDIKIKNEASVDMQNMSSTKNVSISNIVEQYKKAVKSQALSDLKQNTGYGANSPDLKSLVDNKVSSKNQSITDNIKLALQKVKISGMANTGFSILVDGPLSLKGITLDQYSQTRIITSNIMTSASNMGKSIALDILQESATTTKSEQTSTGQEKLMADLLKGQLELSKANAEGASKLFGQLTSFMSFGLIGMVLIGLVALMFLPNLLPGKSSGVIGIIVSVALIYLIAAWFLGWFPFSKSNLEEIRRYRFDDIPRSTMQEEIISPSYVNSRKNKNRSLY